MFIKQGLGLAALALTCAWSLTAAGQGKRVPKTAGAATTVSVDSDRIVMEKINSKEFIAAEKAGDTAGMTRILAGTTVVVEPPVARPTYCLPPAFWVQLLVRVQSAPDLPHWQLTWVCIYGRVRGQTLDPAAFN